MKVLLAGAGGQLGLSLSVAAPAGITLVRCTRQELDISDLDAVRAVLERQHPDVVINAAAYTAVDAAETDADRAFAVNRDGAGYVAAASAAIGARLIHVSTDYVFDGNSPRPYGADAATAPLGVYGQSKLEGELRVTAAGGDQALILRTAWLYSARGRNFALTMLRLMGAGGPVRVVADQAGSPTWTGALAEAIWRLVATGQGSGVLHWTNAGLCSWFDFAMAIMEEGRQARLLESTPVIVPIRTGDYPTAARRPAYSVLDCTPAVALLGYTPLHWRSALRLMLRELAQDA